MLSEVADFEYKCTEIYYPEDGGGVIWNDPDIGIPGPSVNRAYPTRTSNSPASEPCRSKPNPC